MISRIYLQQQTGVPDHKNLWPLELRDWLTLAVALIVLPLAAAGGQGGGFILVPLLILVAGN